MTMKTKQWKDMTVDEKFDQHTLEFSQLRNRVSLLQMQITEMEKKMNEIQTKMDSNR
jgi:predicted  nucleic acid-binding Zn-ribbon protein